MSPALRTSKITIPKVILKKTFDFLRSHGMHGNEGFAIWVGSFGRSAFEVSDAWFPEQYNTPVYYEVSADELHRVNVELNDSRMIAIAQIHSHPGSAFHSGTDDDYASLYLPGSFSIVVPDFGFVKRDHDTDKWAVFRYDGEQWKPLSKRDVKDLICVT